jgi:pimeloyl-ACP methyl ester carboxylesterase
MDKDEYEKTIGLKGRNSYMFRHGYMSRLGVTKATSSWGTEDHKHPWFYKYLDDVKMMTVQDGKLAKCFDSGEQKIIPLVFCHGLAGSRTTYSGTCRDLASHGYIVFTLSHFDGTANYSKKKNGDEKIWTSI